MNKVDFCFRLEKEVKWAKNSVGEPAECYSKVSLDLVRVPNEEEYSQLQGQIREMLAKQLKTETEHITPISYQEWAENQDEEGQAWEVSRP